MYSAGSGDLEPKGWGDFSPRSCELFLDTSIHVSRHKGLDFLRRLRMVKNAFRWVSSSTYTKVEYGNTILSTCEYLLRKLEKEGFARTLDWVTNVLPAQSPGRRTFSLNLLHRTYGSEGDATRRAMAILRRLMKLHVNFIDAYVDQPVLNGTDCYWAKPLSHRRPDGSLTWKRPRCTRKRPRCRVHEFFRENEDVFSVIKDAIDGVPTDTLTEQLKNFSRLIGEAHADPCILLEYRNCRAFADAIIAVDSKDYKNFFSQNARESCVLCEALGQTFIYLPPNYERGVLVYDFQRVHSNTEADSFPPTA